MDDQPHHVMQQTAIFETGAEEYTCPTCGRLLIIKWPRLPVVLVEGDPNAIHSGGKGGLEVSALEVAPDEYPDDDWVRDND